VLLAAGSSERRASPRDRPQRKPGDVGRSAKVTDTAFGQGTGGLLQRNALRWQWSAERQARREVDEVNMNMARWATAVVIMATINACAKTQDVSEFDNTYVGRLNNECYDDVHLRARVTKVEFLLTFPPRRDIHGTVAADGTVTATGEWSDEHGPVHAVLHGQIAGKALGHTLTAAIRDDRCNPEFALAPIPGK